MLRSAVDRRLERLERQAGGGQVASRPEADDRGRPLSGTVVEGRMAAEEEAMRLEVEKSTPVDNPSPAVLRKAISKLRSYGPTSYASLIDASGNYLQVAGGGVTCSLERRDAVNRRHYRAHLGAPSKAFPDGTLLVFSGGEIKLQADEWLISALVEDAFLAFMEDTPFPEAIQWREMTAMFEDLR